MFQALLRLLKKVEPMPHRYGSLSQSKLVGYRLNGGEGGAVWGSFCGLCSLPLPLGLSVDGADEKQNGPSQRPGCICGPALNTVIYKYCQLGEI